MKFGDSSKVLGFVIALALVVSACSQGEDQLTQQEIADILIADGLDKDVADCVAGIEAKAGTYADDEETKQRLEELTQSCESAQSALQDLESEDKAADELAFAEPNDYGDDTALDALWEQCESGQGASCDELFSKSPIGSEYEKYGLSCGRRPAVLHCTELDTEDGDLPVPEIAATAEESE